ncbi:hypothetical protein [Paenibacillus sp. R14(2021)]|uniref:hypothetical protein n=1 Tax=Paenibacillus sp. R14(2021) TaxID=2859228 RepID=UPI001C615CEA|nr:hypothetical protein [Paenibacillus sp. R14(2021)]
MIAEVAGYVLATLVWSFIRVQSLLRRQKNKEAAIYGGLMAISVVMGALLIGRVKLPSFTVPLQLIFEPIGKMLLKS